MVLVTYECRENIAIIRLNRPEKRNAMNDAMLLDIEAAVERAAQEAKVGIICGEGVHFCSGLDLSEQSSKDMMQGITGSRAWHAAFSRIQHGSIPYVAALHGAVIGGGLELAANAHIRVAEEETWFAMPEVKRGIFVGGGGTVNISRLLGVPRMMDMMLTGRIITTDEAERMGIVTYVTPKGGAFDKAFELAKGIAANPALVNYVTINSLQRINDSGYDEGLFFETMIASMIQSTPEAIEGMRAFVEKRAEHLGMPKMQASRSAGGQKCRWAEVNE